MRYLIALRNVSKPPKNIGFVGCYLIISKNEYVKMLRIQSKFWENSMIMAELQLVHWIHQ